MRFSRWTNHSLPQTLQIAVFLLYFNAAFGFLGLLGLGFSNPWALLGDLADGLGLLAVFLSSIVYLFAGLAIANEQKRGWAAGVGVAAGAVAVSVLIAGPGILVSRYVISFMFDVALVVALLHPLSRNHQRIWFQ